ncbi:hypothetical protein BpHYR1_025587 [Brachionus plicatilis]|uniref:Uncharacterized protein n=1 Tax=Brachionus plicatilis TaxID=10195 RepID=A0A3M7S4Z1_BRAPC|nr:hypothetical protein BpHYR1_025587 [Brachionus plicatilis]
MKSMIIIEAIQTMKKFATYVKKFFGLELLALRSAATLFDSSFCPGTGRVLVAMSQLSQKVLMLTFHMSLERPRVTVALVTAGRLAHKRLFVLVRQQMTIQMVLALERLVAQVTTVLSLVAVNQSMLGQGAFVREYLAAVGTRLNRRVGLGGQAVKRLGLVASVPILVALRTVRAHVFGGERLGLLFQRLALVQCVVWAIFALQLGIVETVVEHKLGRCGLAQIAQRIHELLRLGVRLLLRI